MHQLESMKEMLMSCVQGQMSHLDSVDAKELGEAVDMIKDLSEAIYYCTVTEAMKEKEKGHDNTYHHYYTDYRDMDRYYGRMYYDGQNSGSRHYSNGGNGNGNSSNGGNGGSRSYEEHPMIMMRDSREGRSPMSRKSYMESKEMHQDKTVQMRELEKYMQELSHDVTEMISDASPEEKQVLQQRITALANKIK